TRLPTIGPRNRNARPSGCAGPRRCALIETAIRDAQNKARKRRDFMGSILPRGWGLGARGLRAGGWLGPSAGTDRELRDSAVRNLLFERPVKTAEQPTD